MSRQIQSVCTNQPNHRTTYTPRDETTRLQAKVSRQMQLGAKPQPNHRTNYTPRDTTTRLQAKVSRQMQSGAQNPPASKTRATAVMLFVSVGTVVSCISGTFADYARPVRNARPVRHAHRGPACALTVDAREFIVALRFY